eukprot:4468254-Pyramimonas_sp.AAC.1
MEPSWASARIGESWSNPKRGHALPPAPPPELGHCLSSLLRPWLESERRGQFPLAVSWDNGIKFPLLSHLGDRLGHQREWGKNGQVAFPRLFSGVEKTWCGPPPLLFPGYPAPFPRCSGPGWRLEKRGHVPLAVGRTKVVRSPLLSHLGERSGLQREWEKR